MNAKVARNILVRHPHQKVAGHLSDTSQRVVLRYFSVPYGKSDG